VTFSKEFLESDISVAQIPGGSTSLLAALAGIPIYETPGLKYDEMVLANRRVLVGDQRHFLWRMKQIDANHECRRAAAEHIKTSARRILGEEWKLSPK
jgi:hypothetical protein